MRKSSGTTSRHNLLTALNLNSDDRFPVLKKIKESNTAIYKYIIDNIDGYLNFLNDDEYVLDESESLADILSDIYNSAYYTASDNSAVFIDSFLSKVSPEAKISSLNEELKKYAPDLLRNDLVSYTFHNIFWYLKELMFECDNNLAIFLTKEESIRLQENIDEEQKVAISIINASSNLNLSGKVRLSFVANLKLDSPVSCKKLHIDNNVVNEIYPDLIGLNIIPDSAESFQYIEDSDWSMREKYIYRSKNFCDYSDILSSSDSCRVLLLEDKSVSRLRQIIMDDSSIYLTKDAISDTNLLVQACCVILKTKHMIDSNVINLLSEQRLIAIHLCELIQSGLGSAYVIDLLIILIDDMPIEDVFCVLQTLNDPQYDSMVTVDRKTKITLTNNRDNLALLTAIQKKTYEGESLLKSDGMGRYIKEDDGNLIAYRKLRPWLAALREKA